MVVAVDALVAALVADALALASLAAALVADALALVALVFAHTELACAWSAFTEAKDAWDVAVVAALIDEVVGLSQVVPL